jgi:nitrate reductase gamma subunit
MWTQLKRLVKRYYHGLWLFLLSPLVIADEDPFPTITTSSGDVVTTTGSYMETTLKYALIGGGGLLILICLAIIVHRLREDSREKDHGNLVMTFILIALGLTLGFIMIGIGWTAFSAQPSPP